MASINFLRNQLNNFIQILFAPVDGSSLAIYRIVVGILLLCDIINERGLSQADLIWATDHDDEENFYDYFNDYDHYMFDKLFMNISPSSFQCRFPLFQSITRIRTAEGMYSIYLIMVVGKVNVFL